MAELKPAVLTTDQRAAALAWQERHKDHVARLVRAEAVSGAYPPSGSDVIHPELWRPPHWRWLMEVCNA